MFFELIIAIIIGTLLGVVTGLTPGIHINLVAVIILSLSSLLLNVFEPLALAAAIVAMSITHTFVDFIPSIILGAPDADTAMAVLPGHALLLEGRGHEAMKLTVIGGILSLILVVSMIPLLIIIVPKIFFLIKDYIGWILIAISALLIMKERGVGRKSWAFLVFMISGVLGLIALNRLLLNQPLFPLLSGLFGISLLTRSIMSQTKVPEQWPGEPITLDRKDLIKPVTIGTISSSLVSIFPGIGPAQAAAFSSIFFGELNHVSYLIAIGGINTVSMLFALITLFTISKARNGSIAVMSEILGQLTASRLAVLVAVSLISGALAVYLTLRLSEIALSIVNKVDYSRLSFFVILVIAGLVTLISGWIGLIVLIVAASIGTIPTTVNIARSHLMGCIILPVILFYLV